MFKTGRSPGFRCFDAGVGWALDRFSINFNAFQGFPLDFLGFPMDFPGFQFDFLGFPLDFQGFPLDFQGFPFDVYLKGLSRLVSRGCLLTCLRISRGGANTSGFPLVLSEDDLSQGCLRVSSSDLSYPSLTCIRLVAGVVLYKPLPF